MKKTITSALIAAMIVTMAGCSDSGKKTDATTKSTTADTSASQNAGASEPDTDGTTSTQEKTDRNSTTASADTQMPTEKPSQTTDKPAQTTVKPVSDTTTKAPDITTEVITTTVQSGGTEVDGYNVIGDSGILVIGKDGHYWGLMPCWGTYGYCDNFGANLEKFSSQIGSGVKVYNMVIPTSVEFYLPAKNEGFTASQANKIDYLEGLLTTVKNVNVYDALKAHANEQIYARTDHHWQPLGAYYAAKVFADMAGVAFPMLSTYTKVERDGYVGSMYTYAKDEHLKNDPETFTMYISPNADNLSTTYYSTAFTNGTAGNLFVSRSASAFYCSFLGADNLIAEIDTDVKNGKTLVIFKESYGNALVPFLTSGFEKIYVCDIRYFDLNAVSFCKKVGATEVLFANCTFTPAGTNGNYLSTILA